MSKLQAIASESAKGMSSMFWMKTFIAILMVLVCTTNVNAALYESNMGWTDSSPVLLSPVVGYGPDVYVTFESSRGSDISGSGLSTLIGYHHGGSNPVVTMTFSSDVTNVELFFGDLDVRWEELDLMSPVPVDATGDLYITSGGIVRSSVNNGAGSIIYDSISTDEVLQFRFDDQLSNLAITELNFQVVPIPGAVWLLGSGIIGIAGLRRQKFFI